jgi:hypothetical protein
VSTRCAIACALALSCALAVPLSGQTPTTFRARTDIVPVFVSVRAGESFIGGLRQRDFELDDNGVPQQIDSVSSDAVPIDVTLVVDTSSSVIGSLDQFKADVVTIAGMLRPDEQMRLVTFDTGVREILPMQPAPASPPIERIRLGDQTSLNDALLFSLARERRPDRRHLVFVFTDGFDTASVLDYGSLPEVASRADALLHIVTVRPALRRDNANTRPFGLPRARAARSTRRAVRMTPLSRRSNARSTPSATATCCTSRPGKCRGLAGTP